MKYIPIIIFVILFLACGNGKGGKNNEPYDGGHGIGIDTATIHQIDLVEDSVPLVSDEDRDSHTPPPPPPDGRRFNGPPPPPPHEKGRPPHEPDNMRGFDPASEDDMDDNGMSRYMDNNDEEGWDQNSKRARCLSEPCMLIHKPKSIIQMKKITKYKP